MNKAKLQKVKKLASEVDNFNECYANCDSQLWGERDGPVSAESLLIFLIDNPHLAEIALDVDKLERGV